MATEVTTRTRLTAIAFAVLCAASWASTMTVAPAHAETARDSAKTVTAAAYDPDVAHSPFPDLKVTVSQTKDLIQQGITVSWTGGKQSTVPTAQTGGANYLQLAQCWGDEPGSNGTRPDRTTCQYGGLNVAGDSRFSNREAGATIAPQDTSYTAVGANYFNPTMTAVPFASVTGKTVASVVNGTRVTNAPDLNNNEFFNKYTTNEVAWAGSGADGSGSVKFELQTAQQAPGLGCGERLTTTDGTQYGRPCWLVVIPRGETDVDSPLQTKSGLLWQTWQHHLAVRLDFKPSGLSCQIGSVERQLSGSELLASAVSQWQPRLCGQAGGATYSLLTGPESDAAAAANQTTTAPLALTSRPLPSDAGSDHLGYAPVALTGASIAFAVDRNLDPFSSHSDVEKGTQNLPFSDLKLNPRLVAKLLTASYSASLPTGANKSHLSGVDNLTKDPEFLAINSPEWAKMSLYGPGIADLQLPLGRSDVAYAIWSYVMSDADARNFLAGAADPWGMKVNPYYSTSAKVNPAGVGLSLPRDDFPKADPTEYAGTAQYNHADAINLVTYRPYVSSLDSAAYLVLRGDAQMLGDWDATSVPPKYGKAPRSYVGTQRVLGMTDTASASKYQVFQASLRNPAGKYVAPSAASLTAAAAVMAKTKAQSQVVSFDPQTRAAKAASNAYPLAMPVYAAVNPAMSDAAVRSDYAAFITYAVNGGQVPGTGDGQLPDGYAPLPRAWKSQALTTAAAIRKGAWPAHSTPTPQPSSAATGPHTTPTSPSTPSPANPAASGASSGTLNGKATPDDPRVGAFTAVVPGTAAVGLLAALGVPLVSRLRARRP